MSMIVKEFWKIQVISKISWLVWNPQMRESHDMVGEEQLFHSN